MHNPNDIEYFIMPIIKEEYLRDKYKAVISQK